MVKVEISLEAFQPTIINVLIIHKFQLPLHSVGAIPWPSGGIKLDYMNIVPTIMIKPHEIMPVFLYYYYFFH